MGPGANEGQWRRHLIEPLRLMWECRWPVLLSLIILLGLTVVTKRLVWMAVSDEGITIATIGKVMPILLVSSVLRYAFAPAIVLHAALHAAQGRPTTVTVSLLAALRWLPWFILLIVVARSFFTIGGFVLVLPFAFVVTIVELTTGPWEFVGSLDDNSIPIINSIVLLIMVPLLSRVILLAPAFMLEGNTSFPQAVRRSIEAFRWIDMLRVTPYLAVFWFAMRPRVGSWAVQLLDGYLGGLPMDGVYASTLTLPYAAFMLLLVATVPIWMEARQRESSVHSPVPGTPAPANPA